MGKKHKHRRPTRPVVAGQFEPKPDRLTHTQIEQMVVTAARMAFGTGEHPSAFNRALTHLVDAEANPASPTRPSTIIATMLQGCVVSLYEHGWQPADIAHTVKRQWTQRAHRLSTAVIAADARATDAAHRAPEPWLAQLDDLGVYDSGRRTVVGGHDGAFAAWARAERLDPDEALAIGLRVLGQLLALPRQSLLIDPPSAWGASNRGTAPKPSASGGDIDAKALKLIRALLAKAENTTFEAEAETFTAKAQEMMTRYSIDAAVLASSAARVGGRSGVESRRVHIDSPYADEKAVLLSVIADVNGSRSVWAPMLGFATVMGFPVDLHLTDILFTSLLVQATKASAEATAVDQRLRTPSFRRAFLIAFAHRIGERLDATKQRASAEAEQQYGAALVPILADRVAAIDEAFSEAFPDITFRRSRRLNAAGYHAGRAAADQAHIGAGAAIAPA